MEPVAIVRFVVWAFQGMHALSAAAQGWTESAAAVLIDSVWQGAAVACGLAVCLRLAPRIPARLRYAVWATGFAAVVCLPFLPALVERLTVPRLGAAPAQSLGLAAASQSQPLFALDARWSLALAAIWLAACLVRAVGLAGHAVRMRRLWNSASPVDAARCGVLEQRFDAGRMASVELCVTSELDRPCVIGFFRPRILIPAWLLNRLTQAELDQVVLHEREHLLRKDDWANLLQKLCLVVFPLNLGLWWLERLLCAEREMACDDGVVRRTHAPRAYAACLAGLAEKGLARREAALSLGAWRRRPELAERVQRLLRRRQALSPAASAATVALVGCGLMAGTIGLARCPEMVAFVVAPSQTPHALSASAEMASEQFMEGDVRTDMPLATGPNTNSGSAPYRAVKTMARLPGTRVTSLPREVKVAARGVASVAADGAKQADDSSRTGHSLASLVPTAVAAQMKAQQRAQAGPVQNAQAGAKLTSASVSGLPAAAEVQTNWIVLTTFEEVQTTDSGGDVQGDAAVSGTGANSGAEARGAKTAASISVTRLVLRFDQPTPNAQPASKAQPGTNAQPASNSTQPIAIPYRDGWFVIQL